MAIAGIGVKESGSPAAEFFVGLPDVFKTDVAAAGVGRLVIASAASGKLGGLRRQRDAAEDRCERR